MWALCVIGSTEDKAFANQSPFIWHELVSSDQKLSGSFFTKLFGWESKEVDSGQFGTYTVFSVNGQDVAGMMNPTNDTPGEGSYWHSYIAVESVEECSRLAPSLGGKVVVPPHDVPDVGRVCIITDPTGAVVHLMQPFQS